MGGNAVASFKARKLIDLLLKANEPLFSKYRKENVSGFLSIFIFEFQNNIYSSRETRIEYRFFVILVI